MWNGDRASRRGLPPSPVEPVPPFPAIVVITPRPRLLRIRLLRIRDVQIPGGVDGDPCG